MKTTKKQAKRRGGLRKKRTFRKARDVGDFASCSVKRTIAPTGATAYNTNTLYNLMNTQLVDYDRAANIAVAYQHFRIKKISVTFKPTFDNFLASGGSVSKTYLYWMIDKSGSVPTNISLEGLKQMGAKPIALDEKPITISWRPSVLQSVMYAPGVAAATPSKYLVSPWLSTVSIPVDAGAIGGTNGTDHLGLYWYVDQLSNPIGMQYAAEVEVQFQFKKPLADALAGVAAVPSVVAELNNSPDGIVGGGDGI